MADKTPDRGYTEASILNNTDMIDVNIEPGSVFTNNTDMLNTNTADDDVNAMSRNARFDGNEENETDDEQKAAPLASPAQRISKRDDGYELDPIAPFSPQRRIDYNIGIGDFNLVDPLVFEDEDDAPSR